MNFLFYVLVSIRLDASVEDEVEVMVAFTDMTPADEETVNLPVVNDYQRGGKFGWSACVASACPPGR
tara:strand:+ start:268 stop:468 length:201 start_codon:yes stop_codon:yes gene_type:complete